MIRWQWVAVVSTVLILPACVPQTHQHDYKKSSQHPSGEGSIFAPVSEESVRNDVRAYHAEQPDLLDNQNQQNTALQDQSLTSKQLRKATKKRVLDRSAQWQALLVDIPVPLNVKPIAQFFTQETIALNQVVALGYKGEHSIAELVRFYQQGMERNGWRAMASGVAEHEALECFAKPDRFCSVSFRASAEKSKHNHEQLVEIIIFTGPSSSRL